MHVHCSNTEITSAKFHHDNAKTAKPQGKNKRSKSKTVSFFSETAQKRYTVLWRSFGNWKPPTFYLPCRLQKLSAKFTHKGETQAMENRSL
jgi:hypothetical protein